MRPDRDISGATGAHRRLVAGLVSLTDEVVGQPSRLPGWTVGHVLTHLARNADSHVRMLAAAQAGQVGDQYPGGFDQRAADIEAGASRGMNAIAGDVVEACRGLESAWAATEDQVWRDGQGRAGTGICPLADLPFRRWREADVHHADLGLSYSFQDWPGEYVALELERAMGGLADRLDGLALRLVARDGPSAWTVPAGAVPSVTVTGERRRLLAWLLGRRDEPDWPMIGPWQPQEHWHLPSS